MNEMEREMSLDNCTLEPMRNLRYLKIYSSHCPQQCKSNNKINLPDGLNLPLEEVRYLHWLEFPLKEIPPDFNPHNLVDLKLPYSKVERIWSDDKVCLSLLSFDYMAKTNMDRVFLLMAKSCVVAGYIKTEVGQSQPFK